MPFNLDFVMHNVLFFRAVDNDQQVMRKFGIRRMPELACMRQAFHSMTECSVRRLRECVTRLRKAYGQEGLFSETDLAFTGRYTSRWATACSPPCRKQSEPWTAFSGQIRSANTSKAAPPGMKRLRTRRKIQMLLPSPRQRKPISVQTNP